MNMPVHSVTDAKSPTQFEALKTSGLLKNGAEDGDSRSKSFKKFLKIAMNVGY
jgi:hypothetical protein